MKPFLTLQFLLLVASISRAEAPTPLILTSHTGSIMSLAFSPDGKILASSSRDKTFKFWDPRSGKLLQTIEDGHTADVYCITFSARGDLFATCSADKTILIWNARTTKILRTLEGHSDVVRAVAFAPDA